MQVFLKIERNGGDQQCLHQLQCALGRHKRTLQFAGQIHDFQLFQVVSVALYPSDGTVNVRLQLLCCRCQMSQTFVIGFHC